MPLSDTELQKHPEDAAQRHPTTGRAPAVNETEHAEHAHRARHVMPDGTVMEGAHHDHSHHARGASSGSIATTWAPSAAAIWTPNPPTPPAPTKTACSAKQSIWRVRSS